jgi:hypothetical protein
MVERITLNVGSGYLLIVVLGGGRSVALQPHPPVVERAGKLKNFNFERMKTQTHSTRQS